MALPALPAVANIIGSAGLWTGASQAFKKAIPKAKNAASKVSGWLGRNTGRAGAGAGGIVGGLGLGELMNSLGIEDSRLQKAALAALGLGAIAALGQLFNIEVGS